MSHDERSLELISALIDGELSPDEEARARQLLAADSELQRYHDELVELRSTVQRLPRYELPNTFVHQVLRRAEREMLSSPGSPAGAAQRRNPTLEHSSADTPPARPALKNKLLLLLGAVAAVAAIVLVAVGLQVWNADPKLADNEPATTPGVVNDSDRRVIAGDSQQSEGSAVAPESALAENVRSESPGAVAGDDATRRALNPDDARPMSDQIATDNSRNPASENATGNVSAEAPMQMPMYAFVLEVVLTSQGIQQDTFHQSLARSGIHLQNAIPVERSLEGTLLAHQYFGGVKPEDLPIDARTEDEDGVRDHLEIFFLVCTGPQLDQLMVDLAGQDGYVLAVTADLTSARSDLTLYDEMQKLVSRQEQAPASFVGAHPLALEEDLRERLLVAMRDAQRAKDDGPMEPMPPDDAPNVPIVPDAAAPAATPQDQIAAMAEEKHMILVVLRSADTVE